ncbi:alpha/beta hydrolase [Hymenobacter sp. RP-2-7]|uniref:Alpha/beta hydrolase n=1 Tax=Hymenobacter polaris TaxID=2682546 RepID=A0A7Y0AAB0_9BACT|nr:alpha/beta hydrolase [Hymenobacter polaris]NML63667.1 alpha/beta hydrolase [Hymenobacter polaris]
MLTHETYDLPGLRMHVAEQGEGPLVVLCHGFPETWYSWRHQLPALAQAGFRVVAPDLRGYGATDQPAAPDQYNLLQLVGDLVNLLDTLGEPQAVIVGHDWGASVAWQAALLRPDRFRAVAGLSVPPMAQPPAPPTTLFPQTPDAWFYTLYFQPLGLAEAELEHDVRLTLRKVLVAASGEAGPRHPGDDTPNPFGMVARRDGLLAPLPNPATLPNWLTEADLDVYAQAFATSGFRGGLNYYRNLDRNRELLMPFSGQVVAVPALFMVGDRDVSYSSPMMQQLIAALPRTLPRLHPIRIVPGAGHWLQQERPEVVTAALLDFLRSLPAS